MTIRLNVAQLPIEHVGFSYSVLSELLLSLNVLNNHKRHPLHIAWALDANRRLSAELRAEYRRLRPVIATASAHLLVPDDAESPDFAREFSAIHELSATAFAELLINDFLIDAPPTGRRIWQDNVSLHDFQQSDKLQEMAAGWLNRYYGKSADLLDLLCNEPAHLQARLLTLVQTYWDAFFEQEWQRLEPIILAEIAACGRRLMRDGVVKMAAGISERFSIDETRQTLTYVSPNTDENWGLGSADFLNLYPSYFTYPSLIFAFRHDEEHGAQTLSMTYPMPQQQFAGQPPVPPEQLLTLLRAVADSTRLQILQLVAQQPRSTSELARIIRVSDAAISKQLKQMQRAGWVQAQRDSYYVLYSATDAPIAKVTTGLNALLTAQPFTNSSTS